ncbi:nonstructural NSm protein [Pepper chlorotic spot virus]|uniref:Nonstructural NSm protein n=1 Tax=Pepper chlorotic spot virus TaxID=1414655 RepID=A0A1P8SKG8_9VIRU|nr:nonstructural NSm protein [Pepper chlorotic spot virus]APY22756.1 nonstructural NSm protein [Pepper chlorotic spot virus]
MSRLTNVLSNLLATKEEKNTDLTSIVKKDEGRSNREFLTRAISKKDVETALNNKAKTINGKQYISGMDSSILGSYSGGESIDSSHDDILSRLVVEQSTHLSNWKNDSLVGNGNDKVSCNVQIMPTWNSSKRFMSLSRLIVWVVPMIPDPKGCVKATIIDQNKMTVSEKVIIGKQSSLADPMCFIFHLNWSFPKERNNPKNCMILNLTSNEKYSKGVSFASVMYSWVKNFCDTPIASEKNTCDVVPINRAKIIQSAALIEACKLMIPKGTSGKQISSQIKRLQSMAEKVAIEEDSGEINEIDVSIDPDYGSL